MDTINTLLDNKIENRSLIKERSFDKKIFYISNEAFNEPKLSVFTRVEKINFEQLIEAIEHISSAKDPDAIIFHTNYIDHIFFINLSKIAHTVRNSNKTIPIIIVSDKIELETKKKVLKLGGDDCFPINFNPEKLNYWIEFLKIFKRLSKEENNSKNIMPDYKIGATKRIFDVIVSGSLLLLFSPIMLVITLIIKLESKGPVFYVSKRAGVGYKIFNFLKFRSMADGADKELSKLSHLNQYGTNSNADDSSEANSVFFKIKDDPRITKFGKFLRDTSLDEIPQLINVLKGDMSIVGNRPLPLYEAQQLTKDQCALRFRAAAGITGLWQVTKRGKAEMSEEERISLDFDYAKNNSFKNDMKLLFKTVPALLQEEKV
ncbi:sugar transferase [Marivirga sp.]|uniref:sugar transferase n=1 Tax=Marivirga sp. TaxID=2018662 RepID=UPI0025F41470|nr:sugar transferase [Marivirga sp.]